MGDSSLGRGILGVVPAAPNAPAATAVTSPRRPGRPPRSQGVRAANRARLLDAAIAAIRCHGAEVSMDELAAAVGVSKPVLYGEFGGRGGIADEVAKHLAEQIERTIATRLAAGEQMDAVAVVRLIVTGLVDIVADDTQLYGFLARRVVRQASRGFLDNALAREFHQRASIVLPITARSEEPALFPLLADGLFGFMFAAVESWQARPELSRAELIAGLSVVVVAGLQAVSTVAAPGTLSGSASG